MQFDPTKPVRTREGDKARIIATDRIGKSPIVAFVMGPEDEEEELYTYHEDGSFFRNEESGLDLVNVPEQIELFYSVSGLGYVGGGAPPHRADLKITFEDGKPVAAELLR